MRAQTGAAVLVRLLRLAGVERVFTLSGNQILPIYDAGIDAGLAFTDTRHEAAAAHMADAWARVRGEPGVCLFSAGPGHTNALSAILNASRACSETPYPLPQPFLHALQTVEWRPALRLHACLTTQTCGCPRPSPTLPARRRARGAGGVRRMHARYGKLNT